MEKVEAGENRCLVLGTNITLCSLLICSSEEPQKVRRQSVFFGFRILFEQERKLLINT